MRRLLLVCGAAFVMNTQASDLPMVYKANEGVSFNKYEEHLEPGFKLERRGAALVVVKDPHVLGAGTQAPRVIREEAQDLSGKQQDQQISRSSQAIKEKEPGFVYGSGEYYTKRNDESDPLTKVLNKSKKKYIQTSSGAKVLVNIVDEDDPDYLELMGKAPSAHPPETQDREGYIRKDGYYEAIPTSKMGAAGFHETE